MPTATPPKPTIVFDGDCAFCRRQIDWIRSRDRAEQFAYLPRQAPDLPERFPQLTGADLETGLRLVRPDGAVLVGADAVYAIVRRLPVWRHVALLYRLPGGRLVGRKLYGWIAARRHRLAARCTACAMPEESSRKNRGMEVRKSTDRQRF